MKYPHPPDEIKEKLEGAKAVHDFALFRNRLIKQGNAGKLYYPKRQ